MRCRRAGRFLTAFAGLGLLLAILPRCHAEGAAPAPAPAPIRALPPEPVVKIIPLLSATFDEVVPLLQDELSPQGKLSYFKPRNALVVKDEPARVERIAALMASLDKPAANIRVEVEFLNAGMSKSSGGAVVTSRHSGPAVLLAPDKRTTTTDNTTQFIMARSGYPAKLWAGESVPQPTFLRQYNFVQLQPGRGVTAVSTTEVDFERQEVGSALYVTATYQDSGLIEIELYPVVTYKDQQGAAHALRVQQVSTRVVARNGERVLVGGADKAAQKFYQQFLGPTVWSKEASSESLSIYLTPLVRVMDRAAPVDHTAAPGGGQLPPPIVVR